MGCSHSPSPSFCHPAPSSSSGAKAVRATFSTERKGNTAALSRPSALSPIKIDGRSIVSFLWRATLPLIGMTSVLSKCRIGTQPCPGRHADRRPIRRYSLCCQHTPVPSKMPFSVCHLSYFRRQSRRRRLRPWFTIGVRIFTLSGSFPLRQNIRNSNSYSWDDALMDPRHYPGVSMITLLRS